MGLKSELCSQPDRRKLRKAHSPVPDVRDTVYRRLSLFKRSLRRPTFRHEYPDG